MGMSRDISLARREPHAQQIARVSLDVVTAWAPRLNDARQRHALNGWLAGDSAEQIGQELNVTRERVRHLVRFALLKIGAASRGELDSGTQRRLFAEDIDLPARIESLSVWLRAQNSGFIGAVRGRADHSARQRRSPDHAAHRDLSVYLDGALASQGHHLQTRELEAFCLHLEQSGNVTDSRQP